jgi:membrane fusion protein (multidrug efflux system)
MKLISTLVGLLLLVVLVGVVMVMIFKPHWLQPATVAAADDEDVNNKELEVPVHTARVTRETLHRYVEAYGAVEPAPARKGRQAGTADIASPVAGVVREVLCEAGQKVSKGDPLIQLDDRLAKAAEDQAVAALNEAKATLAQLKATPRPEQLAVAQLAIDKAHVGVEFAQKGFTRQQGLADRQITAEKIAEQAKLELASAQNELAVAEKQLALLKASPTKEELAAQSAKVAQAEAALAAAHTQRNLLTIVSPMDATVVFVTPNPGEAVDTAKVLVDVVALDRLIVTVPVPAEERPSLHEGEDAQVQPSASAGKPLGAQEPAAEGKVYFIGPEIDRKTNSVPVGIELDAKTTLRPGQFVRARILVQTQKDCLAVPKESIFSDANGDPCVALVKDKVGTKKVVQTGVREGNLVEITSGDVQESDVVVTGGAYTFTSEKVQGAPVKVLD